MGRAQWGGHSGDDIVARAKWGVTEHKTPWNGHSGESITLNTDLAPYSVALKMYERFLAGLGRSVIQIY